MNLTDYVYNVLANKLPSNTISRIKVLYKLDKQFYFNRLELSKFLSSQKLIGYSRRSLNRLLGPSIFNEDSYRFLLQQVNEGLLDPVLLELWCQSRIHKKIEEAYQYMNGHP